MARIGSAVRVRRLPIALAASGHRVGALDLDGRQRTMTRYFENRDATMRRLNTKLPQARYAVLEGQAPDGLDLALRELCEGVDVIVIDTPAGRLLGHDGAIPGFLNVVLSTEDARRQVGVMMNEEFSSSAVSEAFS